MNDEKRWSDRALGMNRSIRRRDFLNGVAIAIGAGLAGSRSAAALAGESWPQDRPGWSNLTRLLTIGKERGGKGNCILHWEDVADYADRLISALVPDT